MPSPFPARSFVADLPPHAGEPVLVRGWVHRLRVLARTTFVILQDCTGQLQCVAASGTIRDARLKLEDAIEIAGTLRADARAPGGVELAVEHVAVLNRAAHDLPFNASADLTAVGLETLIDYRPLSLRNERVREIFTVQAALLEGFRAFLRSQRFTEIVSSKIVGSGTEGGTNLFEIRYFERAAYLAQSPQFYKEHGVLGLERVFETGHVYRAEPHATSRHLTEYYSLDLEMGFIDGPDDVIQLERELLTSMFERLNRDHGRTLARFRSAPLPSMMRVPAWTFDECLDRLGRRGLADLDPDAERRLCGMAHEETGVPAVFVVGFPLAGRPFYTHPLTPAAAAGFDLLFAGVEITTGGQRLHRRADLEAALAVRGMAAEPFEHHLRMFDLGMPPHGGLAIGLERLTAGVLGLRNVREATLYPRDRYRVTP